MARCSICGTTHATTEPCPSAADPRIGETLGGRYQILRRLSVGGMGSVYEARHVVVQRHFAIKILHADRAHRPRIVQRFEQEARAVGALASEHLVAVLDFGEVGGLPYFVMELLQGMDLRELLLESSRLSVPRAASIAIDVCRGLRLAHAAGLVHRDLKPANIFLTRSSEGREIAKVLDFGVAKLHDVHASTGEGTLIGTVGYMAPEQVMSGTNVDGRTDVYALGIVLYEMLAGARAYEGERAEVLYRIVYEDPPVLSRQNLPPALGEVVARAIARDPSQRYPDVVAFARALTPFTHGVGAVHSGAPLLERGSRDSVTHADPQSEGSEGSPVSSAALPANGEASALGRRGIVAGLAIASVAIATGLGLLARRPLLAGAPPTHAREVDSILAQSPPASGGATPGDAVAFGQPPAALTSTSPETGATVTLSAPDAGAQPAKSEPVPPRTAARPTRPSELPWPAPSAQFDPQNPYDSPKP